MSRLNVTLRRECDDCAPDTGATSCSGILLNVGCIGDNRLIVEAELTSSSSSIVACVLNLRADARSEGFWKRRHALESKEELLNLR